MNNKYIKKNIQKAREDVDLTQEELASRIGISRQAFNGIENGNTNLIHKQLPKIAQQCGVSVGKLLLGYEPNANVDKISRNLNESIIRNQELKNENIHLKNEVHNLKELVKSQSAHIESLKKTNEFLSKIISEKM